MTDSICKCRGSGWVCESHPDKPFAADIPDCECGGAGSPCGDCNRSSGRDDPPRMPLGTESVSEEGTDYALLVYDTARRADEGSETLEQALDLLCDAAALLVSEGAGTLEQSVERISEAVPVYKDAEFMVRSGAHRLN